MCNTECGPACSKTKPLSSSRFQSDHQCCIRMLSALCPRKEVPLPRPRPCPPPHRHTHTVLIRRSRVHLKHGAQPPSRRSQGRVEKGPSYIENPPSFPDDVCSQLGHLQSRTDDLAPCWNESAYVRSTSPPLSLSSTAPMPSHLSLSLSLLRSQMSST